MHSLFGISQMHRQINPVNLDEWVIRLIVLHQEGGVANRGGKGG